MNIDTGLNELSSQKLWRAVFAEYLGCMFFLLCVTNMVTIGNYVGIALGVGLAIASLAQAFGHVSGGHLNPAVSLGMIVGGRISIIKGLLYIVAQCAGAVAGSALTYGLMSVELEQKIGVTRVNKDITSGQAFGLELLFTFLLVFFVFSITDEKKKVEPYGITLGIGIVVTVAHFALIPYTGSSINPARSFGPALILNDWKDHWVYWVGPMVGGAVAPLVYDNFLYVDDEKNNDSNDITELKPLREDVSA
ncbi:aquaporin AQPAe.a-like [Hydractinia symbiolongicarpus]|uniref:aquaporin AQPAe.a-like n=1 Tax=Hydractinia symbiolongicarpus TaxID=13093 RepID=UPI00254D94E4|nr:aquaporin AQPAe.a-like [Hydractinia symbiolongicarpus]XP_057293302.1 aquaporin AQPAe.a-like [Hydractinia symbiolongicarpus]